MTNKTFSIEHNDVTLTAVATISAAGVTYALADVPTKTMCEGDFEMLAYRQLQPNGPRMEDADAIRRKFKAVHFALQDEANKLKKAAARAAKKALYAA